MSSPSKKIEVPELISFLVVALVMLGSSLVYFPSYLVFFVALAIVDGLSTYAKIRLFLVIDRCLFGFALILMSAVVLQLNAVELIAETLALITILDFSLLLRRLPTASEPMRVIKLRAQSYVFSVIPAGVFSIGMLYIYSVIFLSAPSSPVLELGVASGGIFVVITFVIRAMVTSQSSS